MDSIERLIQRVQKTQHGFLDIQKAADEVFASHSASQSLKMAQQWFASDIYQVRSLATFILGRLASRSDESVAYLKNMVSEDTDWRVQEILAKAFDRFCADTGYEKAMPVIQEWLADRNPNVRRAVTEGLRIWTGRPYFREHPKVAVQLLSSLRGDESDYVRKSVGNALRDISKKHPDLIKNELSTWNITSKQIQQTYKLAGKFVQR
jgi:3-methyladenine DNA glycosylase AlkD